MKAPTRSTGAGATTGSGRGPRRPAGALPIVLVNGRRVASGGRHVSAFDRGFTLADGIFETMRAYGGTVFRLDAHLDRLARGAAALEIGPLPDVCAAVRRATAVAGRLGALDAGVRVTLTRGAGGGGVAPTAVPAPPTVIVAVSGLPDFPAQTYANGLHARVASGRRNEYAVTAGLKTLAYTDAVAAVVDARRAGADDALFLDTAGHCSEAASSNLFAVADDVLLTPPASCGALPGITRAAVIELARGMGVPVVERAFGIETLLGAREAFLTSSLREIAPLVRVDGHPLGNGAPGVLTRDLMAAYSALVRQECVA